MKIQLKDCHFKCALEVEVVLKNVFQVVTCSPCNMICYCTSCIGHNVITQNHLTLLWSSSIILVFCAANKIDFQEFPCPYSITILFCIEHFSVKLQTYYCRYWHDKYRLHWIRCDLMPFFLQSLHSQWWILSIKPDMNTRV